MYVNVFDLKGKRVRSALNVELAQGGYEATTPWEILDTSRAWAVYVSVIASGVVTSASSSNVYDGTVSVNIPVTLAAMPSDVAKFVNWVWDNRQASGGYLNYCIRWQSATKLTQTYRDKMKAMLARQSNAWTDYSSTNDTHFDMSLWGTTGFGYAGAVGDWNIVPKMVMWAGSSTVITETDAWSLRKVWHQIKGNFGY